MLANIHLNAQIEANPINQIAINLTASNNIFLVVISEFLCSNNKNAMYGNANVINGQVNKSKKLVKPPIIKNNLY